MRLIRECGWRWLTRLKANRRVSVDCLPKRALERWPIAEMGTAVHLEAYGLIRVFRVVATDGDAESRATDDAEMDELVRLRYAEFAWGIEVYHRALKQACGVERAMVRAGWHNAIISAWRFGHFVPLEWHRVRTGIGRGIAKGGIIRHALRSYLTHPWYCLPPTA